MIKVKVDVSELKNEINRIYTELHETKHLSETEKQAVINIAIEKLRTVVQQLDQFR